MVDWKAMTRSIGFKSGNAQDWAYSTMSEFSRPDHASCCSRSALLDAEWTMCHSTAASRDLVPPVTLALGIGLVRAAASALTHA